MMRWTAIAITLALPMTAAADEYRHVGDFLLKSHFKLTGDKITPIPMKTLALRAYTDGVRIKISAEGDDESVSVFEIYRSDGIGRQRSSGGALEVIPGVQATSHTGGLLRHLRMSRESLTITTFHGVSDQTVVSHAIVAAQKPPGPESTQESALSP
jgi:hypothetical protein